MENSSPLAPEILVPRIGEYLVDRGLISKSDLDEALAHQKEDNLGSRPLLGQVLVKLRKISPGNHRADPSASTGAGGCKS